MLPEEYALDEETIGSRIKGKTEKKKKKKFALMLPLLMHLFSLTTRYKKKLKRLQQTGGGLGGNDKPIDDFNQKSQDCNKYLNCYIPNTRPDTATTKEAKNI